MQDFYRLRIDRFQQHCDRLQQTENRLSLARLVTFILIFAAFFALRSWSVSFALAASTGCLATFGWLIRKHVRTENDRNFFRIMADINTRERNALAGDISAFPDGSEFLDRDHPYSYDLDVFGHASVFQFLNRTVSLPGARLLAQWLKQPAAIEEIMHRQEASSELKPEADWRQQFMASGFFTRQSLNDPGDLLRWMESRDAFRKPGQLIRLTAMLSLLTTGLAIWAISGQPAVILLPALAINFVVYFTQGKKINRLHQQVSRSADLLQTYAGLIALIEKKTFGTRRLKRLQQAFLTQPMASAAVKQLSKLVNRLDTRLNILVAVPLNLFFFWDIRVCLALERWKRKHAGEINGWLSAMAEFEVLNSLANAAFNNPGWTLPEIVPDYFTFLAKDLGHPLIPENRRIPNDIQILSGGRILIITGSNMSGKSTFLRTCGVNTVLALSGAPVCATALTLSHVSLYSSMRILDSLEDNTSSFYAELKRLAVMIRRAEQDPRVFLLLDEILRGTNSQDRYTGSVALIKQLSEYGTVALVATHDLKLAGMEKDMPGRIDNYHFDVKVDGEELYFDYKLTPGICRSMNASILMKKMGIRI